MKTAKYRKRCFDQIEGVMAENKALAAEHDREQPVGSGFKALSVEAQWCESVVGQYVCILSGQCFDPGIVICN